MDDWKPNAALNLSWRKPGEEIQRLLARAKEATPGIATMQTAVDMESPVITSVEGHFADRRYSECPEQVLQNTINNLEEQGITSRPDSSRYRVQQWQSTEGLH